MIVALLVLILIALLSHAFLRRLLSLVVLGFLAAVVVDGAQAQGTDLNLPSLDPDTACARRTRFASNGDQARIVRNSCIADEQQAYDYLKQT